MEHFAGMFAFALWDSHKQSLWVVRDRIGIKPLFFACLNEAFVFGSEIKAILEYPNFDRAVDFEALSYYLALNYTPAPYTLFSGVRQLMPGEYLIIEANGKIQQRRYWDIEYHEDSSKPEKDLIEEFTFLLESIVSQHLVSDVQFGAFLSGGLDSSSIVYWMSHLLKEPVKTFTIGFTENEFDESPYALQIAEFLNTSHHMKVIKPDATEILPKLVWHAEEPTADSSMLAVYYLSREARQEVAWVLSGDGSDEILAGYETYQAYYLLKLFQLLPKWFREICIASLGKVLPVSDKKVGWDMKLERFLRGAELPPEDAHATWRMIFGESDRKNLLAPIADNPLIGSDFVDLYREYFSHSNATKPLNRMLYVDTRFYLPNDMLVKVDRMSMAHGLEARVPFLDHRLVEFAASLPTSLKIKWLHKKKYILKRSMKNRIPENIINRPKAGFNVPKSNWIKSDLKPFVTDVLSSQRIKDIGFLDTRFVESVLQQHFNCKKDNSFQIWCLLNLSFWWQQFQNRDKPYASSAY